MVGGYYRLGLQQKPSATEGKRIRCATQVESHEATKTSNISGSRDTDRSWQWGMGGKSRSMASLDSLAPNGGDMLLAAAVTHFFFFFGVQQIESNTPQRRKPRTG